MRVIRVDEQVYRKILAEKHRLERESGRRKSMSQAARSLIRKAQGLGSLESDLES